VLVPVGYTAWLAIRNASKIAAREGIEENTRALALCLAAVQEARTDIRALTYELIRAGK
jgi:hypothetical protein